DGARIQAILKLLVDHNLDIGLQGKGRGCWTAFGYVLARNHSQVIALHDCDITSYSREYLARLCYPIANPNLGYEFCKGYYSRVTDRLHGRVTRLFFTPMIRSLQQLVGPHALLTFLDSFRYPLAGEFAMVRDLAWTNRIPGDWGLEIGVLAEVYRNCALRRICQADIADAYDHKHQELSDHNPDAGLLKMCVDITKSLFRNLASEGVVLSDGILKTLRATYLQAAQEAISRYENDAAINSLTFDRHEERTAVEVFLKGMKLATDGFLDDPLGVPMISNWSRVVHAVSAGLAKYFPYRRAVLVNSDGGSSDDTAAIVARTAIDYHHLLIADRQSVLHRIITPYHGIPGKGSAFRTIFEIARRLQA